MPRQLYRVPDEPPTSSLPPRLPIDPPKPTYQPSRDRVFLGAFNRAIAEELQKRLMGMHAGDWREMNEQQETVLNWALLGQGSCNTIARAGTGKTTLALELARRVGDGNRTEAKTMHALGLRMWAKRKPGFAVEAGKLRDKLYEMYPYDRRRPENKDIVNCVVKTVGFAKQMALTAPASSDPSIYQAIIDDHELADDLPENVDIEKVWEDCASVYAWSLDACYNDNLLDYDDMILAPLHFEFTERQYDWFVLDEAQDTNEARRLLAAAVLKPGGRMVAVGDPAQSVYAFAGASCGAMALIQAQFNSCEMPLSVTYRCPKEIVRLAQQWVPEFTAHESAPEGKLSEMSHTQLWTLARSLHPKQDVILCRNTRPLAGIAERFRKLGVPCVVEGQSAKGLVKLATKWGKATVGEMVDNLKLYVAEWTDAWTGKGRLDKVERLQDKAGMVLDAAKAHMDGNRTTEDVVKELLNRFGEGESNDRALRLCTVHRAKGREWDRVLLVGRDRYMPSKFARTAEELEQERNLEYVAVTRVKRELVEVKVPPAMKGEQVDWWDI